ncbi:MAG: DUF4296 domain-containing protein [Muribaculaceae bacterium]|nr:DUF4296 domain-containing protein [Muribaculaceae bacterium]
MRRLPLIVSIAVLGLLAACKGVPGHVLSEEKMARLLADRHVAEAVVDNNGQHWRTDSQRIALRDAVYARYGVTQADVDTSLDWYAHNISRYMEVYDRTIEILEKRLAGSDSRLRAVQVSVAGDSIDVWPYSRYMALGSRSPSHNVNFSLDKDDNRERGDYYTWRMKFANNVNDGLCTMVVEYSDSIMEFVSTRLYGNGWQEISIQTDSTRTATRIYGSLMLRPGDRGPLWLDSISLVRSHLRPDRYGKRYSQRSVRL